MTKKTPTALRILLSAYACEPDRGSEPGVGWRWVCGLTERVDLAVLTRRNNKEEIEDYVGRLPLLHPLRDVEFFYHDLPQWLLALKRLGLFPTMLYYFLWQWTAARTFNDKADSCDIVHHLTFCTTLCPGFWRLKQAKFVIGPTGIPMVLKDYFPLFGRSARLQQLRAAIIRHFIRFPWPSNTLRNAAAVIPSNSESSSLLQSLGLNCHPIILDTGCPDQELVVTPPKARSRGECRFLYAGRLEKRKGLELALRAFTRAVACGIPNSRFVLLGDGPDRARLELLAQELGVDSQVEFVGAVPHPDVAKHFAKADVFVFTSVRDTSGGVNLEAMCKGLPLLCIAHQGVGDITDDLCAVRVAPGPIKETIEMLADGMVALANNPERRRALGVAAIKRARECFSWDEKFDRMVEIYGKAVTR